MNIPAHRFSRRTVLLYAALLSAVVVLPAVGGILSERYFFEAPFDNERLFRANLNIALGEVSISKADSRYLFQAEVELENDRLRPKFDFQSVDGVGTLAVDIESDNREGRRSIGLGGLSSARASQWILHFGDRVPAEVDLKMGLARGTLDFTGIPLKRLSVDCGASRSNIVFDRPNPVEMEALSIKAGASTLSLHGLGFARARNVSIDGGAGRYHVDFTGGPIPRGATASVSVGMAALTIVLPEDIPISLKISDSFLTRVDPPVGFVKMEGGWWQTQQFDAARAFHLNVKAGVGTVRFVRSGEISAVD